MPSFLPTVDHRRAIYLNLVGSIESQLRDAYARQHETGIDNQTTIAKKLGVGRSVINRRLTGQKNMTIETLADMVWALGQAITVRIFDPLITRDSNMYLEYKSRPAPIPVGDTMTPSPTPITSGPSPDGSKLIVVAS